MRSSSSSAMAGADSRAGPGRAAHPGDLQRRLRRVAERAVIVIVRQPLEEAAGDDARLLRRSWPGARGMTISTTHSPPVALCVATMSVRHRNSARPSRKLGAIGALLALLSACSPAPMPVSQSSRDPSSPSAPEGVTPAVTSPVVAAGSTQDSPGHDHHHDHAQAGGSSDHGGHGGSPAASDAGTHGAVYVCPMHREVTSHAAGICPKCNMKLVPKK